MINKPSILLLFSTATTSAFIILLSKTTYAFVVDVLVNARITTTRKFYKNDMQSGYQVDICTPPRRVSSSLLMMDLPDTLDCAFVTKNIAISSNIFGATVTTTKIAIPSQPSSTSPAILVATDPNIFGIESNVADIFRKGIIGTIVVVAILFLLSLVFRTIFSEVVTKSLDEFEEKLKEEDPEIWEKLQSELKTGEKLYNRPDIVASIPNILAEEILDSNVLGNLYDQVDKSEKLFDRPDILQRQTKLLLSEIEKMDDDNPKKPSKYLIELLEEDLKVYDDIKM